MANNRLYIVCGTCYPHEVSPNQVTVPQDYDKTAVVFVGKAFGYPWQVRNERLEEDLDRFFEDHSFCMNFQFVTERQGAKRFSPS